MVYAVLVVFYLLCICLFVCLYLAMLLIVECVYIYIYMVSSGRMISE